VSNTTEYVSKKVMSFYITVIFVIFMLGLLLVAFRSSLADNDISNNAQHIREQIYLQCLDTNRAAAGTNAVLDALIDVNKAVKTSVAVSQDELDKRISRYEAIKITLTKCSR
jgi:hypothetical protein